MWDQSPFSVQCLIGNGISGKVGYLEAKGVKRKEKTELCQTGRKITDNRYNGVMSDESDERGRRVSVYNYFWIPKEITRSLAKRVQDILKNKGA